MSMIAPIKSLFSSHLWLLELHLCWVQHGVVGIRLTVGPPSRAWVGQSEARGEIWVAWFRNAVFGSGRQCLWSKRALTLLLTRNQMPTNCDELVSLAFLLICCVTTTCLASVQVNSVPVRVQCVLHLWFPIVSPYVVNWVLSEVCAMWFFANYWTSCSAK